VFELLCQFKEANSDIDSATSQKLLQHILELLPQAKQIGLALSVSTDFLKQKEGIQHVERAISRKDVDLPFALDTIQWRVAWWDLVHVDG
jgi:hypothetical protein